MCSMTRYLSLGVHKRYYLKLSLSSEFVILLKMVILINVRSSVSYLLRAPISISERNVFLCFRLSFVVRLKLSLIFDFILHNMLCR